MEGYYDLCDDGSDVLSQCSDIPAVSSSSVGRNDDDPVSASVFRERASSGRDYKEMCARGRDRLRLSQATVYPQQALRSYVIEAEGKSDVNELTTEVLLEVISEFNSHKASRKHGPVGQRMENWIAVECCHKEDRECMPSRHIHLIYEKFCPTIRGEHIEQLWQMVRKKMRDQTSSTFKVKSRKIKNKPNHVETSAHYGILMYMTAGLYSKYPCKKNLVGNGDLYDQCQQGYDGITDDTYEEYHACHPHHGNCYSDEEADKDSDVNAWDTLTALWEQYGPVKFKDLFRNTKIPQRERIKWSSMKAVDKIQWDNLLEIWMVDVFRPMPYLTVFDKYGVKQPETTLHMHYALLESMMSIHMTPPEITIFKKHVKKWMLGCSKRNTLYISGVPDAGKSLLAEMFCKVFVYYKKNAASKNFPLDGLSDNKLIWLEEFTSHLLTTGNITFFKQIFGGQSIRGDNKFSGIEEIVKTPVLITSNETFDTFLLNGRRSTEYDVDAWKSRIYSVHLKHKIDVQELSPFFDYDAGICGEAAIGWLHSEDEEQVSIQLPFGKHFKYACSYRCYISRKVQPFLQPPYRICLSRRRISWSPSQLILNSRSILYRTPL